MNKTSYEEYLPPEFDSKNELEATLKSYAHSRAQNKTPTTEQQGDSTSRQTFTPSSQFYDENNEMYRSETDLNASQAFDRTN